MATQASCVRLNSLTDYYEILGIPRGSDQDTIRKAYRKVRRCLVE